ncbi:MAG: hypothetical protein JSW34_07325 [Candidatus Zixiibacteriota bacterium]|nr:MAG: hypothetical protein JSW34_07325 [candidate division Zixibacteria bacterium]
MRVALWVAGWRGFLLTFVEPSLWYKIGELLIIAPVLVLLAYAGQWERPRLRVFVSRTRWLMWLGAALNLLTLVILSDRFWWSAWLPILVIMGVFTPVIVRELLRGRQLGKVRLLMAAIALLFVVNYGLTWPETGGMVVRLPALKPAETLNTAQQWRQDLEFLVSELTRLHADPFAIISEEEFFREVEKLDREIPELEDHVIFARMMMLVASIGDYSTAMQPWYYKGLRQYPVRFWRLSDGLFLLGAGKQHQHLLGTRLKGIGDFTNEQVCEMVRPLTPHGAGSVPFDFFMVNIPEILHAVGIIDDMERAPFVLEDSLSNEFTVYLQPEEVAQEDWIDWRQLKPGWPERRKENYWYEIYPDNKLMYFQFSRCLEPEPNDFSEFCSRMFQLFDEHQLQRIVIDFRLNNGGSTGLIQDFFYRLNERAWLNEPGRLFGIADRYTVASAMISAVGLQASTEILFFGEQPRPEPIEGHRTLSFQLPNCGVKVYYMQSDEGRKYSQYDGDEMILNIDFPVERSSKDIGRATDPVLDSIFAYIKHREAEEEQ